MWAHSDIHDASRPSSSLGFAWSDAEEPYRTIGENGLVAELVVRAKGLVRHPGIFSPLWIDWVAFDVAGPTSDDLDVLTALIGHEHFAHDYLGRRRPGREPTPPAHGPYLLSELTPAHYEHTTPAVAKPALRDWIDSGSQPGFETFDLLAHQFVDTLPDDGTAYLLPEMRPKHMIDWIGGIVGAGSGFNEFIFVHADRTQVALVVGSDD